MSKPSTTPVKTRLAAYEPGKYSGKNESGEHPVGDNVLVLPDKPVEKVGNILMAGGQHAEKHALAAETGILIEVGPDAFIWNSDRTRKLEGNERPKPGDRVSFKRYAGVEKIGRDDQRYMIFADHNIFSVSDPE